MARKINLRGLFEAGKISASFALGSENTSSSDGLDAMFDIDPNLTTKLKMDPLDGYGIAQFDLFFNPPIQGNSFRVKTNIRGLKSGSNIALIKVPFDGTIIRRDGVADDAPNEILQHDYDFKNEGLPSIAFSGVTPVGSEYDIEIFNFEIFVTEETVPYEFNDSVLTTQGWNSSRYDGKQLQATKINEFTEGDTSFFGTPVVQNYSRNIYIGSRIIGMESGSIEDTSLLNFPNFSYVTVHEFLTINDDLSITRRTVRGDKPNTGMKNKKGFYQSWYDDFPVGSTIYLQLTDRNLQQSLKPDYTVFNNTGQLQKILLVHKAHDQDPGGGQHHVALYNRDSDPSTDPDDNAFSFATGSYDKLGSNFYVYNKSLLVDEFFSGSLVGSDIISTTSNPIDNSEQAPGSVGG